MKTGPIGIPRRPLTHHGGAREGRRRPMSPTETHPGTYCILAPHFGQNLAPAATFVPHSAQNF